MTCIVAAGQSRLPEMYAYLAELQYDLDHVDTLIDQHQMWSTIALVLFAVLLASFIHRIVRPMFSVEPTRTERRGMAVIAAAYVLLFVLMWWFWMGRIEADAVHELESEISRVRGEIDGIIAKYGGIA